MGNCVCEACWAGVRPERSLNYLGDPSPWRKGNGNFRSGPLGKTSRPRTGQRGALAICASVLTGGRVALVGGTRRKGREKEVSGRQADVNQERPKRSTK